MQKSLYTTDEWHEDMGDCLFFCFPSFHEPPKVFCGTPLDSDWSENIDEDYTHFIILDFNDIFEQAIKEGTL